MIQLMEDCKGSFEVTETCSNFEEAWQTQYGQKILQEFNAFCKNLSRLGLDIVAIPRGSTQLISAFFGLMLI